MRLPLSLAIIVLSSAATPAPAEPEERAPDYEWLWRHAILYRNPGPGPLRQLALSGRLQAQAAWFDTDQGNLDEREWRRFRFGFTADFTPHWAAQLEGEFDLNESVDDWYQRLTDAYVRWAPDTATRLTILKQSAGFTLDGATSSKKLLTLERSVLTDNLWFTAEYFSGVSLETAVEDGWSYKAGIFSADGDPELGSYDAGYFTLARLGYDWAADIGFKAASVTLDFVYQKEDADNNTADFSNLASLYGKWEQGSWGLWTDLSAGRGYADQSDVWGATLMPFYQWSECLQLVLRYTYISSDGENGIRPGRYARDFATDKGDEYREIYGGVNLYLYGHKLKWQTGVEYLDLADRSGDSGAVRGWGLSTGLRIYW